MTKEELKAYLIEEAEYREAHVNEMSDEEMLNAWLTWNGIYGYTEDIIEVVRAIGI